MGMCAAQHNACQNPPRVDHCPSYVTGLSTCSLHIATGRVPGPVLVPLATQQNHATLPVLCCRSLCRMEALHKGPKSCASPEKPKHAECHTASAFFGFSGDVRHLGPLCKAFILFMVKVMLENAGIARSAQIFSPWTHPAYMLFPFLQVFLEDAGFDWKVLGPDVSNLEYVAWVCDQDAYACSGQKCSAQSMLFMHKNWAAAGE